ncbi:MAG: hypothetical protein AAF371_18550 [Pseudomonadota bacterium]
MTAILGVMLGSAAVAEESYLATLPENDPWLLTINEMAANGCRAEPGELMMAAMERGIMPDATMDRLGKTAASGHLDSEGGDADGENLYILKNWKGC